MVGHRAGVGQILLACPLLPIGPILPPEFRLTLFDIAQKAARSEIVAWLLGKGATPGKKSA
jgi:hypothetical protein